MAEDKLRDARKRCFYIVDNDLIDRYGPVIGAYGVAVYNLIARYADNNGENAFPSYPTIAKKLGMSRTKVVQTIELLVSLGLIKKEQRVDEAGDLTSNLYTIVHPGSTPHALPSTPHVLGSAPSEPQVVRHTDGGSAPHVPDQYSIKKTEFNKKEDTTAPQTDEPASQTKSFSPPSENSPTGDPFMDVALKRFQKRQQNNGRHQANRGGQWPDIDAKVPAAERLPLVERLIDMHGLRAAIDLAQDDGKLADMHKLAADLYVMGFKTLADIETVYQRFQKDWRGKTPAGRQLITIASAMKQTPAQPPKQHVVPPPVIAPDWMTYGIAEENQWKVH